MSEAAIGTAADEALALDKIEKRWGRTAALDGASLVVRRRTLHAVLGENGAGKTTLLRVAFGMVRPDAGAVRLWGVERHFDGSRDAIAAGVGMVHQHFSIVPAMTVAENVALGGRGRFDPRATAERVRALGEATGLRLDPDATAGALGVAGQQRLEVLKALARDGAEKGAHDAARLLVLDEPAAVLAPSESAELLGWLRAWVDAGGTAVLITHKLRDALAYADDVTVLRRGRTVLSRPTRDADAPSEAALVDAMVGAASDAAALGGTPLGAAALGTAASDVARSTSGHTHGDVVARLARVDVTDERGVARLRGASLDVRAGEILGVAAVEGSGQRELLRVLAGRLAPTRGAAERAGRAAFIPEDRHRDALLLDGSLAENVALVGAGRARGVLPWPRIRAHTTALVAGADVRGGDASGDPASATAASLSGGNQQKLVVARELDVEQPGGAPPLVVAENPTRGLDIQAAAAVRDRLIAAARNGAGVVLHSGDLDELFALADRVVVVYDGLVHDAPRDRSAVGRLMAGADLPNLIDHPDLTGQPDLTDR